MQFLNYIIMCAIKMELMVYKMNIYDKTNWLI